MRCSCGLTPRTRLNAALSAAFKRVRGVSPHEHRTAQRSRSVPAPQHFAEAGSVS